jgi:hypothetical protein
MMVALRQTGALFIDAYRELNARKLFWVVLVLSGLVVASFAAVGIYEQGLKVLWWEIPIPMFNSNMLPGEAFFYKFIFFTFGFQIWLTWAATILAIVSTASIIPDFVAGGAVDMQLSKPVGRVRLFITKYLTGLLFAGLQVTVFTLAAFLVIGLRGGEWVWALFLAIPLVVLFFSYIYVVSATIGVLTRSTIAALLGAIGFWFFIFLANMTETVFLQQRITYDQAVLILSGNQEAQRAELEARAGGEETVAPPAEGETSSRRNRVQSRPVTPEMLAKTEANLEAAERDRARWMRLHAWAFAGKTVLPKTSETLGMLERRLLSASDMDTFMQRAEQQGAMQPLQEVHGVRLSQRMLQRELQDELRSRSGVWIIGTSLIFQGAVLAFATMVFVRRDF